jgi:hypothetical protein
MPDIIEPNSTQSIIDEQGNMTQTFRTWTQDMTKLDLIVGTGSPEGVVEGLVGQEYMDQAAITGSFMYRKRDSDIAGDNKKGWLLY